MDKHRRARMESLIREELSVVVSREVKDPRIPAVTFTEVSLTEDGRQATIFLLPFHTGALDPDATPTESEEAAAQREMKDCLEGLRSASGFLRRHLAKVLSVRHVPELVFKKDAGLENSMRVHQLLKKLDSERKSE